MGNKKKGISEFYKQIFSNEKLKERIKEKSRQIKNEENLKKLIREEIMPLMKKFKVNFSEEELLKYEEETLKGLSKENLADVSGGGALSVVMLSLPFFLYGSSISSLEEQIQASAKSQQQISIPYGVTLIDIVLDYGDKLELSDIFGNKHFKRNNFKDYPELKIVHDKDSKNKDVLQPIDVIDNDYTGNGKRLQYTSKGELQVVESVSDENNDLSPLVYKLDYTNSDNENLQNVSKEELSVTKGVLSEDDDLSLLVNEFDYPGNDSETLQDASEDKQSTVKSTINTVKSVANSIAKSVSNTIKKLVSSFTKDAANKDEDLSPLLNMVDHDYSSDDNESL